MRTDKQRRFVSRNWHDLVPEHVAQQIEKREIGAAVARMRAAKLTFRQCGEQLGVGVERARQILAAYERTLGRGHPFDAYIKNNIRTMNPLQRVVEKLERANAKLREKNSELERRALEQAYISSEHWRRKYLSCNEELVFAKARLAELDKSEDHELALIYWRGRAGAAEEELAERKRGCGQERVPY